MSAEKIRHTRQAAAKALRDAAVEWGAHIADEPKDDQDLAGRARWRKLWKAALDYADTFVDGCEDCEAGR